MIFVEAVGVGTPETAKMVETFRFFADHLAQARYVFSAKAPEDWRSPKAVANFEISVRREASWTAPVPWRFLTGATALNTYQARC